MAVSVVVGIVVARYLGPGEFGQLSYALAIASIGAAIAEGGVSAVVRREVAAGGGRAAAWLRAAQSVRLAAGVAAYLAVLVWTAFSDAPPAERLLLSIAGLLLLQPAFATADLWLQATLRARFAALAQLGAAVAGAALRLGLVFAVAPVWTFALASVAEAAIGLVLLNRAARRSGCPPLRSVAAATPGAARALWRESWPLLISGLTVMLYIRIDLVMVRQLADETAAGNYAAAVRLSEVGFFVPGAIVSSFLPGLLKARAEGPEAYRAALQRLFDLNAGIAYALAIPIVFLAPWLVQLAFGPAYAASASVLMVHGWTLVWAALGVGRGQFCVNEGLTRMHLASTAAGAALNIALNFLLIPKYGMVGAAWATFAAQALATWGTSFCFAPTRDCARMQTRALLIPARWISYVRKREP